MRRRDVIALLAGAGLTWPLSAHAQRADRVRRIGVLLGTAENDPDQQALIATLTSALAELGWKKDANMRFEVRWAAGDTSRLRAHAEELAGLSLDLILVQGTPGATVLRQVAAATPVVFVMTTDPVSSGLAASLSRPGGNMTGFTNYELTMGGKWIETLREVSPGISRVAVLHNPGNPALVPLFRAIETQAPNLGVRVTPAHVRSPADIEREIDAFASLPNSGLLVIVDFITHANRELIAQRALKHRLPAVYNLRAFAASGGLIAYGVDSRDLFRRAASYIDRILKGAKPADLPVQQPTKFELIVNLKTAKAMALKIPEAFLLRADEVIE